jgi:hypothetical protein
LDASIAVSRCTRVSDSLVAVKQALTLENNPANGHFASGGRAFLRHEFVHIAHGRFLPGDDGIIWQAGDSIHFF